MVVTLKRTYPEGILQNVVLNTSHLDRAVIFQLVLDNQEQWVYWNPYTNQLNGLRKREDVLRQKILAWHEELTVGSLGHLFLFLVGMAMLGSVVSGLWYYRKSLLKVFKVGVRSKNTYLFNADLHKLLGVMSCVFLLLMGGTGTFFHWEKIERMLDEKIEQSQVQTFNFKPSFIKEIDFSIDNFINKASESIVDFVPELVEFPKNDNTVTISGTRPKSKRLLGKFNSNIVFDANSGELEGIMHFEDGDLEQQAEKSFEQLHFGQYGGIWTKLLYAFGGFCLSAISITGFVIWLKKK